MIDPRLNSVHLEMPRRQAFRRVRDVLLGNRGGRTIKAEQKDRSDRLPTAIERGADVPLLDVCLVDREFVYPLHVGLNTLGRSPDNDIVIQDHYVSRRHCTIVVHSDHRVELFDTASKNGTLVNGRRMSGPASLRAGDEIVLCERQLVFLVNGEGASKGANTATVHE